MENIKVGDIIKVKRFSEFGEWQERIGQIFFKDDDRVYYCGYYRPGSFAAEKGFFPAPRIEIEKIGHYDQLV
jgi:hypothetical protein